MSELNRREFVTVAACAAGACMMCGSIAQAEDAATGSGGTKIDAGPVTDYTSDGPSDKLVDTKKIIIVRENGKIFAMSSICTHKMGPVKIKGTDLVCANTTAISTTTASPRAAPPRRRCSAWVSHRTLTGISWSIRTRSLARTSGTTRGRRSV